MMEDREFWVNKQGAKVHSDLVPMEEKLKTELVYSIIDEVLEQKEELLKFKKSVISQVDDYINMMRKKYSLEVVKGAKGNVSLVSFDGLRKVQIAVQSHIDFDEKLTFAKEKLDEYFEEKTKDSDAEIKTLITKAFDVDKKGKVNAKQIISLKGYPIKHPKWLEAMSIIDEAVEIVGSKSYIRFYTRDSVDRPWQSVSLDFSKVDDE